MSAFDRSKGYCDMGEGLTTLLLLVAMIAVFYFVAIRPQRKKQQEHQELVESLGVGDDVITFGGLHGTIVALDDETVDLEVTDEIIVRYQRESIGQRVGDEPVEVIQADGEDASA